jgi:DNA-binding MarR family transcriptional regulator
MNDDPFPAADQRTATKAAPRPAATRQLQGGLVAPYLMTVASSIRRAAATVYRREFGLGQNEWRVISVLGLEGPLSNNEVAERVALDKGQLSREVSRLAGRGLVARARERRGNRIDLTEAGEAVYRRVMAIADRRNRRLLADIGEADRERLFTLLALIRIRAAEMLENGQEAG